MPDSLARVAVVSDAVLPWHRGGKELRYQQLLQRWPAEGLDVTVYTMKWWDDAPPPGPIAYQAISKKYKMYHGKRRSIRQALMFALSTFKMLRYRYDVIEADHMPYLQLFPLRIVASIRRVPLVVTWHEVWGREYWREYLGPAGLIGAFVEWCATKLPTTIAVVSEGSAQRLREMRVPDSKIVVVPNALDTRALNEVVASTTAFDAISVGRMMAHKRIDLILEAVAQIPNMTLGIVGSGPERERLLQQVVDLDLTTRVTFLGDIEDHDELLPLVKAATVFVLPSEREGFGIAVAESLGLGTPVITSDHPDNEARKLVSDAVNGTVVQAGSAVAVAMALEHWMSARPAKENVVNEFWHQHGDLSWDSVAHHYAIVLKNLLK